jgi:DNA-binding Lrp family transcriptional regulator
MKLDEFDFQLIRALKKDARQTIAELSDQLGVPRATVHERISRMKKAGVIKRFTIEEDYARTGQQTLSFVFATFDRRSKSGIRDVARDLANLNGVVGVYILSGEWDLLLKVRGRDIDDIGSLVIDRIGSMSGISRTMAMPCFEATKEEK